ncbi:hypothetical protein KR018_005745, partial [Drosophila ironensis]
MIDLEDLPRLQSLSPAKDIEEMYHRQTQLDPPIPNKKVTVRMPIGPPSKLAKLIKPTVASTPAVLAASLETPPTPVTPITAETTTPVKRNAPWRGSFHFTTLVS